MRIGTIIDKLFLAPQCQGKHGEHRHLSGKGFGRCDPDFRTYVDVRTRIGAAGDRRAYGVADAIHECAFRLGKFDGGKRIGGLARLGYGDYNIFFANDRIAVAELRSVFHFYGDAAKRFDELLPDESGMPRGAARHDDEPPGVQEASLVVVYRRKHHFVRFWVDSTAHAVVDAFGLFEDFLQHEVRESAFLQLPDVHVDFLDFRRLEFVFQVHHFQGLARFQHGDVSVLQVNHLVGIFHDGRSVRRKEKFSVTYADDQRAAFACGNNAVGMSLVDDGNGVCADYAVKGDLHGFQQVYLIRFL